MVLTVPFRYLEQNHGGSMRCVAVRDRDDIPWNWGVVRHSEDNLSVFPSELAVRKPLNISIKADLD